MNRCVAGVTKEWWFHRDGCSAWFTIWRDTTTNLQVNSPDDALAGALGIAPEEDS